MQKHSLPTLIDGWKWHLNMLDNPLKMELWVYRPGPMGGIGSSSVKILVEVIEPGYNDPEYVAGMVLHAADKSMNWGHWSHHGQNQQDQLDSLLFGLTSP